MIALYRHWKKWSGWYWFLTAIAAWLSLLAAVLTQDGWLTQAG